jgi:hypothetical protein
MLGLRPFGRLALSVTSSLLTRRATLREGQSTAAFHLGGSRKTPPCGRSDGSSSHPRVPRGEMKWERWCYSSTRTVART